MTTSPLRARCDDDASVAACGLDHFPKLNSETIPRRIWMGPACLDGSDALLARFGRDITHGDAECKQVTMRFVGRARRTTRRHRSTRTVVNARAIANCVHFILHFYQKMFNKNISLAPYYRANFTAECSHNALLFPQF